MGKIGRPSPGLMTRPGKSIAKQAEGRAGEKYLPVSGRVKTLRAVGDSSEPSQGLETRASLEGSFWSLAAVALDTISTSNDSSENFESTWIKGLSGIGR